jgi:hypothetical protein
VKFTFTFTVHYILSGDQNKKNEIGGACSTYGERRGVYRVSVGNSKERNHLEDLGVYGRIIVK